MYSHLFHKKLDLIAIGLRLISQKIKTITFLKINNIYLSVNKKILYNFYLVSLYRRLNLREPSNVTFPYYYPLHMHVHTYLLTAENSTVSSSNKELF